VDSDTALQTVGLISPGGDPLGIKQTAAMWSSVSYFLQEHADGIAALSARASSSWAGPEADLLRSELAAYAESARSVSGAAAAVGSQQAAEADTHQVVIEIIEQIGVQIAITLGMWAVSALFPPALAAVEAYVSALVVEGSRVLQVLVDALSATVRTLVDARNAIEAVMQLTWRSDNFAIGYGRLITEGVRDFGIDLTAGVGSSAVTHTPLDPLQLFKNALIGGAVGGLLGGIEYSGAKRILDESGAAAVGLDGKPLFQSLSQQVREAVSSLGGDEVAAVAEGPRTLYTTALDNLSATTANARRIGITTTPRGLREIEEELSQAVLARSAALEARMQAADRVSALQGFLDAFDLASLGRAGPADGEFVRAIRDELGRTSQALTDLGSQADELSLGIETQAHRLAGWNTWNSARRVARADASLSEQLAWAWRQNLWRDGLATAYHEPAGLSPAASVASWESLSGPAGAVGTLAKGFAKPKNWQTVWLYDTPRYFLKGLVSNTAKTASDIPLGKATADDVWKVGLIGAAVSSARGAINGLAGNVLWPRYGIEETIWKAGLKMFDNAAITELRRHAHV
jgi:hypothetical protein